MVGTTGAIVIQANRLRRRGNSRGIDFTIHTSPRRFRRRNDPDHGRAFDAARESLQDRGPPEIVYEIIAKRIIEAAKKGERDPIRLRDAGLAALGYKKDAI